MVNFEIDVVAAMSLAEMVKAQFLDYVGIRK